MTRQSGERQKQAPTLQGDEAAEDIKQAEAISKLAADVRQRLLRDMPAETFNLRTRLIVGASEKGIYSLGFWDEKTGPNPPWISSITRSPDKEAHIPQALRPTVLDVTGSVTIYRDSRIDAKIEPKAAMVVDPSGETRQASKDELARAAGALSQTAQNLWEKNKDTPDQEYYNDPKDHAKGTYTKEGNKSKYEKKFRTDDEKRQNARISELYFGFNDKYGISVSGVIGHTKSDVAGEIERLQRIGFLERLTSEMEALENSQDDLSRKAFADLIKSPPKLSSPTLELVS